MYIFQVWAESNTRIYIWIYSYISGVFASCKTRKALTIWMDLEGIMFARWNKSDEEWQALYFIIYMWNLKNKMSECNKTEMDSQV